MFQSTIGFGRRTLTKKQKTNRWTDERRAAHSKAMKAHWDAKKVRTPAAPAKVAPAAPLPTPPAGLFARLVRFFKS